jgi:hypothetical protein
MTLTIIIPKQYIYKGDIFDKRDDISPNTGIGIKKQASSLLDIVISQFLVCKPSFSLDKSGINVLMYGHMLLILKTVEVNP